MLEVKSFDAENSPMLAISHQIRRAVFVEEQGIDETLEYDGKDIRSRHYIVFNEEEAVATGRWRVTSEGIKLERYAVLPKWRNLRMGNKLVQAMLEDVISQGLTIYLHAQITAVSFYKNNGFVIEGDAFYEADIQHYKMKYVVV